MPQVQHCSLVASSRFIRLLVLAGVCFCLPLEALDSDADVGFDDAVPQARNPASPSESTNTTDLPSPAGVPPCAFLRSLTSVVPTPLPPALDGPRSHQIWYLMAARLCARSRIAVTNPPAQELIVSRAAALLTDSRAVGRAVVFS